MEYIIFQPKSNVPQVSWLKMAGIRLMWHIVYSAVPNMYCICIAWTEQKVNAKKLTFKGRFETFVVVVVFLFSTTMQIHMPSNSCAPSAYVANKPSHPLF
jgi:hypothetical protein